MIPCHLACRVLIELLERRAHTLKQRAEGSYRRPASDKDQSGRIDQLYKAAGRVKSLAAVANRKPHVDPAVLGYLTAYVMGHAVMADLLDYLDRRKDPLADRVGKAPVNDMGAVLLAALGD